MLPSPWLSSSHYSPKCCPDVLIWGWGALPVLINLPPRCSVRRYRATASRTTSVTSPCSRELLGGGETPVGERVHVEISGRPFDLSATPAMSTAPDIWLLGSSAYSAEAAGQLGLPYVFANHFGMPGIDETLRLYRESFIPSASFPEPRTLVPVNVVVAENAEEANKLALPQKLSNARLRSGGKVEPQATVDEMENYDWAAREFMAPAPGPDSMFVGTPEHVAEGISALATRLGADEVMVSPVAGAYAGDDVDRGVRREESLRLLAREIL